MADRQQKQFNEALSRAIRTHSKRRKFTARLGKADGTLYVTQVDGTRKPGYVWARVDFTGSGVVEMVVRCRKVVRAANLWVVVAFSDIDDELEVIEEDPTLGVKFAGDRNINVPEHAWQHDRFGADPLYLNGLLFQPFLVTPSDDNDLNVYLRPFYYKYLGTPKVWDGGNVDLTDYVPSIGQDCVIIALDPVINLPVVIETGLGDSFLNPSLDNIPFEKLDIAAVDHAHYWPSAAVRLYSQQTSIDVRDIWFDMRWLYQAGYYDTYGSVFSVRSQPTNPPDGQGILYAAADGLHYLESDGTDTLLGSGGGGGTDDQTASEVPTDTGSFDGNLSGADDTVQKALDTIDDLSLGGGSSVLTVVNNSGGELETGDVVLLRYDGTDGYEAVTTTTANDVGIWAVVETGGADGESITVYRSGTEITVNYTGSAPNKTEYLVTSTTAGSAQAQAYMSSEVFAICTADGVGGTVEVTLLCHTEYISLTSSYEVYRNRDTSAYDFVATINGAPSGATLIYNVPSSGAANTIRPFEGDTTQLAKLRLYNVTRDSYALVSDVDLTAKEITVTDEDDISGWQSGDTITARSQTNTTTTGGGTAYYYDYEIEDASVIPQLTRTINFFMFAKDTAAASIATTLHPWEANATSKQIFFDTQAVNSNYSITGLTLPIINRRFCLNSQASGSGTKFNTLRLLGVFVAAP